MNKRSVFHKYSDRLIQTNNQEDNCPKDYIVVKGDTLYKIASLYNITVSELMAANNLTTTTIYPNQTIVIPRKGTNTNVYFEEYVIQNNDTLKNISTSLGVTIDELMKYNDISKLILGENQIIRFPKAYSQYQITGSDNLRTILEKSNLSLEELIVANKASWLASGKTINIG